MGVVELCKWARACYVHSIHIHRRSSSLSLHTLYILYKSIAWSLWIDATRSMSISPIISLFVILVHRCEWCIVQHKTANGPKPLWNSHSPKFDILLLPTQFILFHRFKSDSNLIMDRRAGTRRERSRERAIKDVQLNRTSSDWREY